MTLAWTWSRTHFSILVDTIGSWATDVVESPSLAGSRNGNAPLGEAWLLEDTVTNGTPLIFRNVYNHHSSASDMVHLSIEASSNLPFQTGGVERRPALPLILWVAEYVERDQVSLTR